MREALPGDEANVVFRDVAAIEEGYESMGLTRVDWEGSRLLHAEVELAWGPRDAPGPRSALALPIATLPFDLTARPDGTATAACECEGCSVRSCPVDSD